MASSLDLDLNVTLGALFIGVILSIFLYGIASLQTWNYFNTFIKDRFYVKLLVGSLWIIDTFHSICLVHAVYYYVITNFMNAAALENGEWSINLSTVLSALVACCCQAFFTMRVWHLGRNIYIAGLFMGLCLTRFALSVVTTWASFNVKPFLRYETDYSWSIRAGLSVATASDVLIAAAMIFYLRGARGMNHKTNTVISRLLTFTIETCLLTSTVTTVDLICFATMPDNFIFLGIYFIVSKLYTNALLTSLNVRTTLRNQLGGTVVSLSKGRGPYHSSGPSSQSLRPRTGRDSVPDETNAGVTITMDTFEMTDRSGLPEPQEQKQTWLSSDQ